jgi:hypothetical protein
MYVRFKVQSTRKHIAKGGMFNSKQRTFVVFSPIPRSRTPVQNGQCTLPLGNAALRIAKSASAGIIRDSAQGRDKKETAYYQSEQKFSVLEKQVFLFS